MHRNDLSQSSENLPHLTRRSTSLTINPSTTSDEIQENFRLLSSSEGNNSEARFLAPNRTQWYTHHEEVHLSSLPEQEPAQSIGEALLENLGLPSASSQVVEYSPGFQFPVSSPKCSAASSSCQPSSTKSRPNDYLRDVTAALNADLRGFRRSTGGGDSYVENIDPLENFNASGSTQLRSRSYEYDFGGPSFDQPSYLSRELIPATRTDNLSNPVAVRHRFSSTSSERPPGRKRPCSFCANNDEHKQFASGHPLKSEDGTVFCPILRMYRCPYCGQTGDNAHTKRYCPKRPRNLLN